MKTPIPLKSAPLNEHRHRRRTPPSARGEAATWITGGALVICLVLIAAIFSLILYQGGRTFWPGPINLITLDSGESLLGVPLNTESVQSGEPGALRQRYRVGNRDLGQESFEWIDLTDIVNTERPEKAWYVEREDWGVFLGYPEAILQEPDSSETGSDTPPETLAKGSSETQEAFDRLHRLAVKRRQEIEHLNNVIAPRLQARINRIEWSRRKLLLKNSRVVLGAGMPMGLWLAFIAGVVLAGWTSIKLMARTRSISRGNPSRRRWHLLSIVTMLLAVSMTLGVALEHPWVSLKKSDAQIQRSMGTLDASRSQLEIELGSTLEQLRSLREIDSRTRIVIRDPRSGKIAPESQSSPDTPLRLSQVVRVVRANQLSTPGRVGVYLSRIHEYLTAEPRSNGSEGGVFPVIVGTVILTLLLNICVVPLGVIAALYLREYARQGLITSIIRISINNLAGVPSIVYGMFGLGFFCYFLGGYLDDGPTAPLPRPSWWLGVAGTLGLVILGSVATMFATHQPGSPPSRVERVAKTACWVLWTLAVLSAGRLVFTSPYFAGFFGHKLPESSTLGSRGILWSALTLALLTLPVVIVATEEAIAAVPNSMREGSLACGASKWQTIRRIVLPSSLPGVMTGAILAMARGAGEVAPLMLVGVVNYAPSLPVSGEFPFLHGDRTFMHLGFHIYSLGFQSPDSEAAKPLVWTTTLLLLLIVLLLNLIAVTIRAKLRGKTSSASI